MTAPAITHRDSHAALRQLINEYAIADRKWSAATDGLTHDIARDIRTLLREDFGLSDGQIRALGDAI